MTNMPVAAARQLYDIQRRFDAMCADLSVRPANYYHWLGIAADDQGPSNPMRHYRPAQ